MWTWRQCPTDVRGEQPAAPTGTLAPYALGAAILGCIAKDTCVGGAGRRAFGAAVTLQAGVATVRASDHGRQHARVAGAVDGRARAARAFESGAGGTGGEHPDVRVALAVHA